MSLNKTEPLLSCVMGRRPGSLAEGELAIAGPAESAGQAPEDGAIGKSLGAAARLLSQWSPGYHGVS